MTLALSVEPVSLSLLISVKDVSGERFWRCRGCRWWNDSLDLSCGCRSRRRKMLADQRSLAGPFLERLLPAQRDERGGEDDFEEEAHFRSENGGLRMEDGPRQLFVIGYGGFGQAFNRRRICDMIARRGN
jgi:hypothetical protein